MSYTPINWQTGDQITAVKMNKMDNGWSVDSSSQTLCNESVTTSVDPEYPDDPASGAFSYSTQITADSVTVTFNGTDYTCQKIDADGDIFYGGFNDGFDFTDYPFAIGSFSDENILFTATGGTYSVKIVATTSTLEVSDNFATAVNSCVDTSTMPMLCVSGATTIQEMGIASGNKRLLYFYPYAGNNSVRIITGFTIDGVTFIPDTGVLTATFVNGVFTVSVG